MTIYWRMTINSSQEDLGITIDRTHAGCIGLRKNSLIASMRDLQTSQPPKFKSLGVSTRQNVNKCSSEKGRTKQMLHWQRPTLSLLPAYHPCHFIILACMPYCHGPSQAEQRAQRWFPCVRSDLKGPLLEISLTEPWVTNPKF